MLPIKFKQQNCTYAKNQKEYLPLPAHKDSDGIVTSCWELSESDKEEILKNGVVYLQILTFNQPLQPIKLSTNNPLG